LAFPGPDRDEALDRRREMVDKRVVPLGPLGQLIDLLELPQHQHTSVHERHVEPKDLHVFAAQVAADTWNSPAIVHSYCSFGGGVYGTLVAATLVASPAGPP
jgi:hypothetical protein